jgi:hypothetical protein
MSDNERIAIVGSGNVGGNLGVRLSQSGYAVRFGVKGDKDVAALLDRCGGKASSSSVAEAAAWGDVIFLAVPAAAAVDAARSLGDASGKVLVDCTNPLRWSEGPVWDPPPEGSVAQAIAAVAPGARVVKAFNTFGAEIHLDPGLGGSKADVYMAADDAGAKETLAAIAARAGFEPIDAGPLRNASVLENLAMLWIHLAMVGDNGRQWAFKGLSRQAARQTPDP